MALTFRLSNRLTSEKSEKTPGTPESPTCLDRKGTCWLLGGIQIAKWIIGKSFPNRRFGFNLGRIGRPIRLLYLRRILLILLRRADPVFALGMLGALGPRQRTDHHMDAAPGQLGRKIGMAPRIEVSDELIDLLEAKLLVNHFTAAEFEGHLDLHLIA